MRDVLRHYVYFFLHRNLLPLCALPVECPFSVVDQLSSVLFSLHFAQFLWNSCQNTHLTVFFRLLFEFGIPAHAADVLESYQLFMTSEAAHMVFFNIILCTGSVPWLSSCEDWCSIPRDRRSWFNLRKFGVFVRPTIDIRNGGTVVAVAVVYLGGCLFEKGRILLSICRFWFLLSSHKVLGHLRVYLLLFFVVGVLVWYIALGYLVYQLIDWVFGHLYDSLIKRMCCMFCFAFL